MNLLDIGVRASHDQKLFVRKGVKTVERFMNMMELVAFKSAVRAVPTTGQEVSGWSP